MKHLKTVLALVFSFAGIYVMAQVPEASSVSGTLNDLFGQYFATTAAFSAAVLGASTFLFKFVPVPGKWKQAATLVVGIIIALGSYFLGIAGIFTEMSLVNVILQSIVITAGANSIWDAIGNAIKSATGLGGDGPDEDEEEGG